MFSYLLTGVGCVKKVVTNLSCSGDRELAGLSLLERAPGVSVDEIKNATEANLIIEGDNIPEMDI